MKTSKEAILLSRMGKKKVPSADSAYDGDFRGIKDGVKDSGPFPSANSTGSSLDLLKAQKASMGEVPASGKYKAKMFEDKAEETGESPVPSSKKVPYSPIKNYLKKGY
jgi:hypothetical protein